jgi:hypothetical protein
MKFFAFTKTGIIRIVAASLMLSVYISTIIMNYASREITSGNFFATIIFIASFVTFYIFSTLKKHPPLVFVARGWLIASFIMSFAALAASSADFEIGGFIGTVLGYGVMMFVSPFFGFVYLFGSFEWIGVLGMILCILIFFIPSVAEKIAYRRKLIREFK